MKFKIKQLFLKTIIILNCSVVCHASIILPKWSCQYNPKLRRIRSSELQKLVNADQRDREKWKNLSKDDYFLLSKNDLKRRKRVGEIFAEGCFKESKDYMAAALIYQHGDTADHYYQAYIWSKRAADLGDKNGKSFSALNIDRYLISIGKKQLFGSQFYKSAASACFCMQPIEKSFPDDFRKKYSGYTLDEKYHSLALMNGANCPKIECDTHLKPTEKGSVIGLW